MTSKLMSMEHVLHLVVFLGVLLAMSIALCGCQEETEEEFLHNLM